MFKFLFLAILFGSCCLSVNSFLTTKEEMKLWLCGIDGAACEHDVESSGKSVWKALINKFHQLGLRHTTTRDGMQEAFRYFYDEHDMEHPNLKQHMQNVIQSHDIHNPNKTDAPFKPPGKNKYPYFALLPKLVTRLRVNQTGYWHGHCFNHSGASVTMSPDNKELRIKLNVSNPVQKACVDNYLFATVASLNFKGVHTAGSSEFVAKLIGLTEADKFDILTKGVRVYIFEDDVVQLFYDILNTATLFLEPMLKRKIDANALRHNIYFLEKYAGIQKKFLPRDPSLYNFPTELIQSGDFLGVLRFDGLDPMLNWAMGSSVGHTSVALRAEDANKTLYICETTTKDTYWQRNGVQCGEYNWWIKQAAESGYNTLWLPLSPDKRKNFNNTAAWNFFKQTEGFDYGYTTLLYGWIDTVKNNYPCVPSESGVGLNRNKCLTWDFIESTIPLLEKLIPVTAMVFSQAFNNRLGTKNLKFSELYRLAARRGIPTNRIPAMVELDSYRYEQKRNKVRNETGISQVCCSFVCNIWKAGGVFGSLADKINCGEQVNSDLYSYDIFDTTTFGAGRPKICQTKDPENNFCQLTGGQQLTFHKPNSRPLYPHMNEHCESMPQDYKRTPGC